MLPRKEVVERGAFFGVRSKRWRREGGTLPAESGGGIGITAHEDRRTGEVFHTVFLLSDGTAEQAQREDSRGGSAGRWKRTRGENREV